MINPIFKQRNSLYAYLAVWALIGVAHTAILYFFYGLALPLATSDSLVFNLIFCGMGLSFWYIVRFVSVDDQGVLNIMFNHLAAAIFSSAIWIGLGSYALLFLWPDHTAYADFLINSLPWRIFSGLLFYSIIVLLYYLIMYYARLGEKIREEAQLQTLVKEAELTMLRSQIKPHFIFNSLNSISSLTMTFPEKAQEMTIKLSDFLRYSLGQHGQTLTSLENELATVSLYLEIEKIRFGSRLQVENICRPDCLDAQLPPMILQPLIENAIKHGVYESIEPVTVRITCQRTPANLQISIWNNFDPDAAIRKGEGIGLRNIGQRMALVYGQHNLLTIKKSPETYEVAIQFPQ